MDFFHRIPTELIYVTTAAIGGIARYLQLYLNEDQFMWHHLLAHTFVSAFSGYMFFQFAHNIIGMDETAMPVIAGMGGWMGVEALKTIESIIKKRFKK